MTGYAYVTVWRVEAPIDRVWDAILHSERWPAWWKAVVKVEELEPGDASGIGNVRRLTWRTRLPYGFAFSTRSVRIEPPHVLEALATGDLDGTGLWRLREEGSATLVRYDWQVRTTKGWMNLLAPLARPLFDYNHKVVMRWGAEGLARLLGTRVEALEGTQLQAREAF